MAEAEGMPVGTTRKPVHTRDITCRGYLRDDGLYDVEGRLTDLTAEDAQLLYHRVPAGGAMHDMHMVMTLDEGMTIHQLYACTAAGVTPDCGGADDRYATLVGLRIGRGFRRELRERVGGAKGCTHLTELVSAMALVAVQTVLAVLRDRADTRSLNQSEGKVHWIVDTCHAFRADGQPAADLAAELRRRDTPIPTDSNHLIKDRSEQ